MKEKRIFKQKNRVFCAICSIIIISKNFFAKIFFLEAVFKKKLLCKPCEHFPFVVHVIAKKPSFQSETHKNWFNNAVYAVRICTDTKSRFSSYLYNMEAPDHTIQKSSARILYFPFYNISVSKHNKMKRTIPRNSLYS